MVVEISIQHFFVKKYYIVTSNCSVVNIDYQLTMKPQKFIIFQF